MPKAKLFFLVNIVFPLFFLLAFGFLSFTMYALGMVAGALYRAYRFNESAPQLTFGDTLEIVVGSEIEMTLQGYREVIAWLRGTFRR